MDSFDALLPLLIGMLLYRAVDAIAIRRKAIQALTRFEKQLNRKSPSVVADGRRLMRLGLSRLEAKLMLRLDIRLRWIDHDFELWMTILLLQLFGIIGFGLMIGGKSGETNSVVLGAVNIIAAMALSAINLLCESLRAKLERLP